MRRSSRRFDRRDAPPTSPLGIFFDRVRRGDLKGLQFIWVALILGSPVAGFVWLQYQYLDQMLTALKWLGLAVAALVALAAVFFITLFISTSMKGVEKRIYESREIIAKRLVAMVASLRAKKTPAVILRSIYASFREVLHSLKSRAVEARRGKIRKAPGTTLLAFAEWVFSEKKVEREFKPIIAEWRYEYYNALVQKRTIKAEWISTRWRYGFFKSMVKTEVLSFFRALLSARK
jgi:hypothetical protein